MSNLQLQVQEIALDILCRMAMFYAQSPKSNDGIRFMDKLITSMPESMQRALKDPKIGPIGILVNMRPSLNEINSGNENVKSFPITAFGIEVARSVPYKRKIASATWLDLSREIFTLYIPEKDVMIKISYHLIARVHFATASNTVQVSCWLITECANIRTYCHLVKRLEPRPLHHDPKIQILHASDRSHIY